MVFPWFSHGFPLVFPWFSHGFPMVFPEAPRSCGPSPGAPKVPCEALAPIGSGLDLTPQMTSLRKKPAGCDMSKHGVLVEIDGICMHIYIYINIHIYIYICLYIPGWWFQPNPSEKWWSSSVGMIFHSQYDGKVNKSCSKPPTRYVI